MNEITHKYGERIHILDDTLATTLLAKVSQTKTVQPELNRMISILYQHLLWEVLNREFPTTSRAFQTRMFSFLNVMWEGTVLMLNTAAVIVSICRAGTLPGHICYEMLNEILWPSCVRQDHLFLSRLVATDADGSNRVEGTACEGEKIGGSIQDRIMLIPDPMGATGGTLATALDIYKCDVEGTAKKWIAMNLIVTPEYIRRANEMEEKPIVYAFRLDRGMSSYKALKEEPGTHPEEESGLNEEGYIIPGAGGLGEIMNNSYC